jgi:serine protease
LLAFECIGCLPLFSLVVAEVNVTAPGVSIRSTIPATQVIASDGTVYDATSMQYAVKLITATEGSIQDCGQGKSDYDFTGVSGKICVMSRGQNSFADKVTLCEKNGGIGAIVYSTDNGVFTGTLLTAGVASIPAVGIILSAGVSLLQKSSAKITFMGEGYTEMSGTSMATPFVTGVIAKIWSARPQCTNFQVMDAIMSAAKNLASSAEEYTYYGKGLVQAQAAYDELLRQPAPCGNGGSAQSSAVAPAPAPAPTPTASSSSWLPWNSSSSTGQAKSPPKVYDWRFIGSGGRQRSLLRGGDHSQEHDTLDNPGPVPVPR